MNQVERRAPVLRSPVRDERMAQAVWIVAAAVELALAELLAPDAAAGRSLTVRSTASPGRLPKVLAVAP